MRTIKERTNSQTEFFRSMIEDGATDLRVSMPGIIQSFDPVEQTVSVQLAITEKIGDSEGTVTNVKLPLVVDVPIMIPTAGGYALTLPIQVGDECLVIFADSCIDMWWQNGGVQNQLEKRRHDLSDSFAIIGCYSQPNRLSSYSTDSVQLRNKAGTAYVEIKGNNVNLVGTIYKNGVIL